MGITKNTRDVSKVTHENHAGGILSKNTLVTNHSTCDISEKNVRVTWQIKVDGCSTLIKYSRRIIKCAGGGNHTSNMVKAHAMRHIKRNTKGDVTQRMLHRKKYTKNVYASCQSRTKHNTSKRNTRGAAPRESERHIDIYTRVARRLTCARHIKSLIHH